MNENEFDLDVQKVEANPNPSQRWVSFVTGIVVSAVVGTYTGDCLTTRCNSVRQCPSPGKNPTYYSC